MLQDAHIELGNATEKVFQQQETYNNILKTDSVNVNAEREVFHKFFAKPQLLLKDMRLLQNSSKAKKEQATPKRTPRVGRYGTSSVSKSVRK